ncbi:hypothetical protein Mapa_008705 [Marchantia paleacea]|nr:hypothetical protein Mapa_008705 [Marchantia paleacea]
MSSDCGKPYGTRDYLVEDFSSPPTRVVWSPLFENRPGRNRSSRVRSSSLKDLNISSDGELPPGWRTAEEQQRNLLLRKYISPRSNHSCKGFVTSSDEDCSRSWKAAKLTYSGLQFVSTELDHHSHPKEQSISGRQRESEERRRFSEGSYGLRYRDDIGLTSRKSDSDISARRNKEVSSLKFVDEGESVPGMRRHISRNTSSLVSEGSRGNNVLDAPQEDWSESELKRTRMETTGAETYTKQRRSKIRVLEESEDLNCERKDAGVCGVGSGGIGRGRVVKGKELSKQSGGYVHQRLVREPYLEAGKVRITGDKEDFIQKCRNRSVADSYINVDGKGSSWKSGSLEDGSDRDPLAHDTRPHCHASMESVLYNRKSFKCSGFSDPLMASPKNRTPTSDRNRDSATDQSSSELGSNADSQSLDRNEKFILMHRTPGQRLTLLKEPSVTGKALNDQLEGKSRRKVSSDDRCNFSQGSDAAKTCHKSSFLESCTKTRKARYDSATSKDHSTVTTDRDNDNTGGSLKEFSRKKRSLRKRRSQSPSAAVACAASMIGDTVEAVRKVREYAAELAFKLAELHAHDAKCLRSAATVMRHHVDTLHTEVHSFQANWARRDSVQFPWNCFWREFLVAASLVSGVFSVQACINSVRSALGSLKQTGSRREKVVLAAVLLTVGARFGSGVYQGLGQVKSVRRARDKQLREHLKVIMERTSLLSTLAHTDPTSSSFDSSTEVEDDRQSMLYSR